MAEDRIPAIDATPVRTSTLRAQDVTDRTTRQLADVVGNAQTVEFVLAGLRRLVLEHVDPLNSIAVDGQQVRLDWELSDDDGFTWRPDGYAAYQGPPGGKASVHQLEFQGGAMTPGANGLAHFVRGVFPAGMRLRVHLRQRRAGRYGLIAVRGT